MTNLMPSLDAPHPKIARLVDANLNRLKEGIRVIEDICRYIHDDRDLTLILKTVRHQLQEAYDINRLNYRDIESDVQKQSTQSEQRRETLQDIIIANFSRTQESSRVLEELFKLTDIKNSEQFKAIRYQLYALETSYFKRHLSI